MLIHLRGFDILPQPKVNTMKKALILLALWASLCICGLSQSVPPTTWTEVDGSPKVTSPTKIIVSNGSMTVNGKTITLVTGGGGGGGCTPPGTASRVLYDDGAGGCTSTSGLTATSSTVTIVSGVTATFSRAGVLYTGTVTTDNASVQTMLLQGDRATFTANDEAYQSFQLSNDAGTQKEVGRFTWAIPTITAGAENGRLDFSVMTSGTLAKELQLSGADLSPSTSDGLALGTASLQWSDLFLASGSVVDFANGNVVLTHSSGILTMGTGELRITTVGTNAASVPTLGSSSILSNKTLATGTAFAGYSDIATIVAPSNPSAGSIRLFADSGTGNLTCLTSAGGNCLPSGSSGITIGTTTVTSGTGGRFIYETTGNVVGEISTLTSDGTIVTFSPTVTTGTGATSGLNATANSLTTGTAFHFSSSSVTSGSIVNIASTSTAGATGVEGLNIAMSGANGSTGQTITGATISVTNTNVTSGTNVALTLTASGATTANTALNVTAGQAVFTDGGVSTPGIRGSDADTGIYFANTGTQPSVSINGTGIAYFNASGFGMIGNSAQLQLGTGAAGFVSPSGANIRCTNGTTGACNFYLGTSTVGGIGSSGVGVFSLANGTVPTTSPTDVGGQFYSADAAAGDANIFVRNEAGEVNRLTGLAARNSAQFDKTSSTALANITGLTRNVEASRVYAFTAVLQSTAIATGGVKFAVSGTATATAISYEGVLVDTGVIVNQTRATALDTTVCASTTSTAGTCTIRGVIQVNAAGTFTIQFAQNASDGTASSVLANQYFQLIPIT